MPPSAPPEKKYKCQYCSRAFSRSEHRSRHERSHTKERPFKCMKCRSTFVRRDLLLRHDRTVHAKDGGVPLATQGRRRGKRSQDQKKDDDAADAAATGNERVPSHSQRQIEGQPEGLSHQQSSPASPPPITRRRAARRTTSQDHQQTRQSVVATPPLSHHQLHPPPPAGSRTIDPAALTATTSTSTATASASILVGSAATPSYNHVLDSDSQLDVDIEAAAMLMTDFRTKAAATTASLRSRTNSPAAGDYTPRHHYSHHPHQQQNPYRPATTSNASVASYISGPTSVPPQATAHLQHAHSGPRSTPDRTVLLEPAVGVGVGYQLRNEGRGIIDGRTKNTAPTSTTPIPQAASIAESSIPPTSAGDAVLPHIHLPGQDGANRSQYYDPFIQHQHHLHPSIRKHARDEGGTARLTTPTILDASDGADQYIPRNDPNSRSGNTPSLFPPSNSGPALSTGRTPPPSSRQSTPLPLSPYNFPYPYPSSLTPGMGLLNPPGPGSTSSANMAPSSSGNINMQSMLNLSPLVGFRKDASVSPVPGLLSSGGGGIGGGGVAVVSNPGPTSVPVIIGENDDVGNTDVREGKRRKGIGKNNGPTAGRRQPRIKFPLDYPDSMPQIATEQDYHIFFANIAAADDADGIPILSDTFNLPRREAINAYLTSYFTHYHPHLPFLHIPTFISTLPTTPPALLLAVLSLGALIRHARDEAVVLHIASKVLVSHFLSRRGDFDSRQCPLWAMQSTLLNMIFGSWSGDAQALEWTCSIKSLLGNLVSGSRYALRLRIEKWERERVDESEKSANAKRMPNWEEWIDQEGCRRTYFAVYVFFGMLTLVFNHPNSMSGDELDELELPCEEEIWAAPKEVVEKFWLDASTPEPAPLRESDADGDGREDGDDDDEVEGDLLHPPTVRAAHDALFRGEKIRYSPFATRIMINVLFYEVWNHRRTIVALQDVVTEFKLRLALDGWESSLRAKIIEEDRKTHERKQALGVTTVDDRAHPPHPLLANSLAVYRIARIRLAVDLKPLQEALRYHSPYEIAASMTVASDLVKRDTIARMEGVARECCEGMEEVVQMFGRTSPSSIRNILTAAQSRRSSASSSPSPSTFSSTSATPVPPTTGVPETSTTTISTFSCGFTPTCSTPRPRLTLSPAIKSFWGVEHPLCMIDMLVILTLWLYRLENAGRAVFLPNGTGSTDVGEIEPEPEASEGEIALYQRVRNLFGGVDEDAGRARAPAELSAAVARIWGEVLAPEDIDAITGDTAGDDESETAADATIWGIEKIIGESFKLHSQALIGYRDDMSYVSVSGAAAAAAAGTGTAVPSSLGQEHRYGNGDARVLSATTTRGIAHNICAEPECRASTPSTSSAMPPNSAPSLEPPIPTSGNLPTSGSTSTAPGDTTNRRKSMEHLRGARGLPSIGTAY